MKYAILFMALATSLTANLKAADDEKVDKVKLSKLEFEVRPGGLWLSEGVMIGIGTGNGKKDYTVDEKTNTVTFTGGTLTVCQWRGVNVEAKVNGKVVAIRTFDNSSLPGPINKGDEVTLTIKGLREKVKLAGKDFEKREDGLYASEDVYIKVVSKKPFDYKVTGTTVSFANNGGDYAWKGIELTAKSANKEVAQSKDDRDESTLTGKLLAGAQVTLTTKAEPKKK